MFKKITFFLSVVLPLSLNQSFAGWITFEEIQSGQESEKIHSVRAVWHNPTRKERFSLESTPCTFDAYYAYVKTLESLPLKEGYPAVEKAHESFKNQNIARQKAANSHHLYTLFCHAQEGNAPLLLGYVQFGRMPTVGYDEGVEGQPTAHHPIIRKYMSLGITRKKDPEGGLNKENIESIKEGDISRGVSFILPIFNSEVLPEHKIGAVEACYEFVCELTKQGKLLPVEKTKPHVIMSLFHPQDFTIKAFAENGFDVDNDPGFGWFYPKNGAPQPRTMVTRSVR